MTRKETFVGTLGLLTLGLFVTMVLARLAQPAHALVAQQCVSSALATQTARERDEWKKIALGCKEACGKIKLPTRTPIARVD